MTNFSNKPVQSALNDENIKKTKLDQQKEKNALQWQNEIMKRCIPD